MPQISDLQALVALSLDGTVSQAAQRLGMSQSSLSYALERMRKRFDDPLFVRVGNRMAPTPLAQQLQDPASRVLRILQTEVADARRFDPATTRREFRLAVNEIGAITMVPRLMPVFARRAPHARLMPVQLDADSLGAQLEGGGIDLAAGHFPSATGTLMQQLLYQRAYVCVARADHPHIGDTLTLEQLARTPQVQTAGVTAIQEWLAARLRQEGLSATVHMISHHVAAVPFMVAASDVIAVVPHEVYELFRPIAPLKMVGLPVTLPPIAIHQYWHVRVAADPAIRFLRELVYETMHEAPPPPGAVA